MRGCAERREAMANVLILRDFRDREAELTLRKKGEKLEVDPARANKLIGLGLAEPVREEAPPAEKKPETKAKKK